MLTMCLRDTIFAGFALLDSTQFELSAMFFLLGAMPTVVFPIYINGYERPPGHSLTF